MCIKDPLLSDPFFGAPDSWGRDGLFMTKELEMKVAVEKLEAVIVFFYLRACFLLEVTAN